MTSLELCVQWMGRVVEWILDRTEAPVHVGYYWVVHRYCQYYWSWWNTIGEDEGTSALAL